MRMILFYAASALVLAGAVFGALMLVDCSPASPAALPAHAGELTLCREKYRVARDAGLDARLEAWAKYTDCADDVDRRYQP